MKKKIFGILLALVLSFSLMMAVPVAAQADTWYVYDNDVELVAENNGTATWVTTPKNTGNHSAKLGIPSPYVLADVARVVTPYSGNLNSITSLSYYYNVDASTPLTSNVWGGFIKGNACVEPTGGGGGYDDDAYGGAYLSIALDADGNTAADTWVIQAQWGATSNVGWQQDTINLGVSPFHVFSLLGTSPFPIGTNWGSLTEVQGASVATYNLGTATVLQIKVSVGEWDPGSSTPPAHPVITFIDSLEMNGTTLDLEPGRIQEAIDAASANDIIAVAAGTYDEQLEINNIGHSRTNLTLIGDMGDTTAGPGANAPILRPTAAKDLVNGDVHIYSDGVDIKGFILDFNNTGTREGYGILVQAANVEIRDNEFQLGLGVTGHSDVSGYGIDTVISTDPGALVIDRNTFIGATAATPSDKGSLGVHMNPGGTSATKTVSNNVFSGDLYGAVAFHTDKVNVTDNVMTGKTATPGLGTFGVHIGSEATGPMSNVTVSGNDISQFGTGIDVFSSGATGTLTITINNNVVEDNTEGVYAGAEAALTVNNNNIVGNTTGVIEDGAFNSTVDAENNWWGDISGPSTVGTGSGDAVSTDVDYIPWLDATYLTGSPLYPAYNSTTSTGYDTIQDAVTAAATGNVLTIAPGTYTGDITISQNLTLVSSGGSEVTKLTGTGPNPVVTIGDFDVTIDGFDIDPGTEGIYIDNISADNVVTIEDSVISGNTADGIMVEGTVYGELYILNNIIADNDSDGINIDVVDDGIVVIQGNKVGAWEDADYNLIGNGDDGIEVSQVLNGSTVTIGGDEAAEANIISGNTSYGIYVYELYYGSTLTIEGNTIGAYDYDGYTFPGNTNGVVISDVDYGSTLTIKDNDTSENFTYGIFIEYLGYDTYDPNGDPETGAEYYDLFQNPSYGANTVTIEGNTASGNGSDGIHISYANFASNITIEDNILSANDGGISLENFGQYGEGFYLDYDSSDVHVDPDYLLYYFGPVVLVKGNTITDNGYGISQANDWEYGTSVTIEDNIITGNWSTGIYHEYSLLNDAHIVIKDNTIASNGIIDGFGGIYWEVAYIEYASSYTVEDNLIAGNWDDGIYITEVRYSSDLIISGNTIGAGTDAQGSQYPGNYGYGIDIGAVYDYSSAEISGNTISGNTTEGIDINDVYEYSSLDITRNIITENNDGIDINIVYNDGSVSITYNDILDNATNGIYIYDVKDVVTAGSLDAHYNNIAGNTTSGVDYTAFSGALAEYVDASNNWWGHISGPGTVGPGSGDEVSTYVTFSPWLPTPSVWGVRVELTEDWNTLSTPIALDSDFDELGVGELDLDIEIAYGFYSGNWVLITTANDTLEPCDAFYVKMNSKATVDLVPNPEKTDPTEKALNAEWNLVSLANLGDMAAGEALTTAYLVPGDLSGYAQVVSPSVNGVYWSAVRGPTIDHNLVYYMLPTKGYWVYMTNAGTLAGFTSTPM